MPYTRTDRAYAQLCKGTYLVPAPIWAFRGPTFHAMKFEDPDGGVTLAIQGSDRWGDWIADFTIIGPMLYDHPHLGPIHPGFDDTTDECLPEIFREVQGRPVRITGHSKGGGEAEVLAAKLTIAGIRVDALVTFGTPRWIGRGNNKASQWLRSIPGRSYRHFKDIVTQIPSIDKHPMKRVPIEVGTGSALQRLNLRWMHSIDQYIANVPG